MIPNTEACLHDLGLNYIRNDFPETKQEIYEQMNCCSFQFCLIVCQQRPFFSRSERNVTELSRTDVNTPCTSSEQGKTR